MLSKLWNIRWCYIFSVQETMPPTESRSRKIQYGRQAAILKMMSLKIDQLQPIHRSIMLLMFEVGVESQAKVIVGNHKIQYGLQAAILEVTYLKVNRLISAYDHNQDAH